MKKIKKIKKIILLVLAALIFSMPISAMAASGDTTVYITRTGTKYHTASCHYLRKSKIKTTLKEAVDNGFTACKVCKPPTLTKQSSVSKSKPKPTNTPKPINTQEPTATSAPTETPMIERSAVSTPEEMMTTAAPVEERFVGEEVYTTPEPKAATKNGSSGEKEHAKLKYGIVMIAVGICMVAIDRRRNKV